MATSVVPVAKAVYLSDDVIEDPQSRKIHLLGTFNAARPQGQPAFPYQPRQICVFAQLVGGAGEAAVHVEIVDTATEGAILCFPAATHPFCDAENDSLGLLPHSRLRLPRAWHVCC